MTMIYFEAFVLGLLVGSFLNVCIYRIPAGQTVVTTPSHCYACGNNLIPLDLVPVLSYLFLRGRCRHCGASISRQYPLVELITGALFLAVVYDKGPTWSALAMLVFVAMLVVVTFIDLEHQIIPDGVLLVGGILGVPLVYLQSFEQLKWGIAGFLAAGLLLLLIAVLSNGGMGGGDIKLAAVMGLYLGLKLVAVALMLAFILGGFIGMILILTGIKKRKDPVPFGPFLAVGSVLASFIGENIIHWYINFL